MAAKLMELEDWKEFLVDEVGQSIEHGEIIIEDEDLEEVVIDIINTKSEQEEIDEEMKEELLQYVDEIADIIRDNYYLEDEDDFEEEEY